MFALNGYVTMSQMPLHKCVFEICRILSSVQMIVLKHLQDELWIENNKKMTPSFWGRWVCIWIIAAFLSFLSHNCSWHTLILALLWACWGLNTCSHQLRASAASVCEGIEHWLKEHNSVRKCIFGRLHKIGLCSFKREILSIPTVSSDRLGSR